MAPTSKLPQLRTPGVIARELGQRLQRVQYILRTRPHIQPTARAGRLRLYDRRAVAMVRHEINSIDAAVRRGWLMRSTFPRLEASQPTEPLLLEPREAARLLRISERTLYTHTKAGLIPALKLAARCGTARRLYVPGSRRNRRYLNHDRTHR